MKPVQGNVMLQATAERKVAAQAPIKADEDVLPRSRTGLHAEEAEEAQGTFMLALATFNKTARSRNVSEEVEMKQFPKEWVEGLQESSTIGQVGPLSAFFCGGVVVGVAVTMVAIVTFGRFKSLEESGGSAPAATDAHLKRIPSGSWATSEDHESLHLFWPRCGCLVLLMLVQSLSSFIIDGFGGLFHANPSLVHFLTMVVGTGGNVGAQSVVLAVRRLALGERVSVLDETFVGMKLSVILVLLAFVRCLSQGVELSANIVISSSILAMVIGSAALGTAAPKTLYWAKIDPAHATPVIQVLMDILGVFVVCVIGRLILGVSAS